MGLHIPISTMPELRSQSRCFGKALLRLHSLSRAGVRPVVLRLPFEIFETEVGGAVTNGGDESVPKFSPWAPK